MESRREFFRGSDGHQSDIFLAFHPRLENPPSARSFLNTVAIFYGSTAAFPFPTMSENSEMLFFLGGQIFATSQGGWLMGFFELVYRTTPQRASRGESTIRSRWIKSGLAGFIHSQYFFFIAVEPVNDGLPKFGNLMFFEGKPPPLISSKKNSESRKHLVLLMFQKSGTSKDET